MFQKKTLMVGFIVVALGLAFGTFFIRSNHKQDTKKVEANSATAILTTQADWVTGTNVNTDLNTSPGSVKIGNSSSGVTTVSGAGDSSYNGIYAEDGIYDSHPRYTNGTRFLFWSSPQWALGPYNDGYPPIAYLGALGALPANAWITMDGPAPPPTLAANATATHTTSPTQIDGGVNFWSWDGFTPTQDVPANTSVAYRYRSSTNGSDWTGWVGSIAAVTSRTGDDSNNPTKYRYLQAEATLSNTDGASSPTIDSYDIGYHIEQQPDKPTAQTAVTE